MYKPKPTKATVKLMAKIAITVRVNVSSALPCLPWIVVIILACVVLGHGHTYFIFRWLT